MTKREPSDNSRLVYSTEQGRVKPEKVTDTAPEVFADGIARVRREVKGRGGKTVTTIQGLTLTGNDLKALAKKLKQRCGTGGAVKQGVIEIQGDHCDTLVDELNKLGYPAKRGGG
ncbi:translation initiation factor [Spartinivicinus ruber]|uniref:translation initiation factor n=1 Tax=Spartinivicinus ruber TaxID=2683272 RepID=UPI0013D126CD|nr:stress response translation initiation inhibitor YciH [Spartinivicinus ruber]